MRFVASLHPLIVHFPIALVAIAAACEAATITTVNPRWRTVAVFNVRVGAVFAVAAAMAGWLLASAPGVEPSTLLEWHRWLGAVAALLTVSAAIATRRTERLRHAHWMYRTTLFCAAAVVAVAGHFGGLLVWGADFLHL